MALSAKTEMNSAPIILRLRFGISDALELCEKTLRSIDTDDTQAETIAQHFERCARIHSYAADRVLTKMLVRRSPMARRTSTAATVESTPPLSAQINAAVPYFRANGFGGFLDESRAAPLFSALQTRKRKLRRISVPRSVLAHLGMKFDGINFAVRIFDGSDGVLRAAHGSKAGGSPTTWSPLTVPDAQRIGKLREEFGLVIGAIDIKNGAAIFTAGGRLYFFRPGDG